MNIEDIFKNITKEENVFVLNKNLIDQLEQADSIKKLKFIEEILNFISSDVSQELVNAFKEISLHLVHQLIKVYELNESHGKHIDNLMEILVKYISHFSAEDTKKISSILTDHANKLIDLTKREKVNEISE